MTDLSNLKLIQAQKSYIATTGLSNLKLTELKEYAALLGIEPVGNKKLKQTWIDAIEAHDKPTEETKPEEVKPEEPKLIILPNEQELISQLDECETEEQVKEICQKFIEKLESKYKSTTATSRLTPYRKAIQNYKDWKNAGLLTHQYKEELQHCAMKFLYNSEEIKKRNSQQSEELKQARASAERQYYDCQEILNIADKLLDSDRLEDNIVGVLAFTGRRKSEAVLGKFIADDTNCMIFNGQAKQRKDDKKFADYYIPVLGNEDRIEATIERIQSHDRIKSIYSDCPADKDLREYVDDKLGTRINERFKEHYKHIFPGKGGVHQLRSIYACTISELYEETNGKAAKLDYIARCLGDEVGQVANYDRLDVKNLPKVSLNLSFKEVGFKPQPKTEASFNMQLFIQSLSPEAQTKFNEEIKSESLEVVLARAYNMAATVKPTKEDTAKIDTLTACFEAMVRYNHTAPDNRKIEILPTTLERVYKAITGGKRMFLEKLKNFIAARKVFITNHHKDMNIPEGTNHNHKRRGNGGIDVIIDEIARMVVTND